ncbi:MAG: hypothetical protein ACRYFW_08395 [Janthinobacterium lividum]
MHIRLLPFMAPLALTLVAVPGSAQDSSPPGPVPSPGRWSVLSVRERIVIRIPRMRDDPAFASPGETAPRWTEKRGDRCVQADGIAGAAVSREGSVDLVMEDGRRARALLEADCPALDYYLGFYIRPTVDGRVCAGRDALRSRSGAICPIRAFRRLVPER